jgi:tRNA-splicing ligase RtcB
MKIFGKEIIDEAAIKQLENCLIGDSIGVLTADAHKGYSMPVGGAIAYKYQISPSGVGFDIGCGNMAVKLEVQAKEIEVGKIMDEIVSRISFGMGRPNNEKIGNDLLIQKIAHFEYAPVRNMWQLAKNQAGTVGGGNHYVDLFEDEGGFLWIGVHFGSRGFGHKIASGFIALSQNKEFGEKASEGSMDSKPILFEIASDLGQLYRECMILAGHYANLGRMVVINKVVEILGYPKRLEEIHNHHNFSWEETHFGETYQVVRKGCTPAFPGQKGFIGANMMDNSVIVEGIESQESKEGLYSTVHGAGRVLSRTQAAGKKKWLRGEDGKKRPQIVAPGIVNWQMVQAMIESKGIELRGAGADEAPQCYKTLSEVLNYQGPTIKVLHELRPIGVAMAGDTIEDPYRD